MQAYKDRFESQLLIVLTIRSEICVTDPLPPVRSFFPHAQPISRFGRQLLAIDCFRDCHSERHDDVVANRRRFEIAQCKRPEVHSFEERNFTGAVSDSIWVNGLKAVGDSGLDSLPVFAWMSLAICRSSFSPSDASDAVAVAWACAQNVENLKQTITANARRNIVTRFMIRFIIKRG